MNTSIFSNWQAINFSFLVILLFTLSCSQPAETATKETETTPEAMVKDYGFIIKGVSGNDVMLDVTWYRDCAADGFGGYMKSMRTMSGHELSLTQITYQNGSTETNCNDGIAMIMQLVQTLEYQKQVPITWVDAEGKPATAPEGLEHITEGNGATAKVTYAVCTPITQSQADGLNYIKFAGVTDWKAGVTTNVLPYFQAAGEMKGTVVVDDRTNIGYVYDGISSDPSEYPTLVPNSNPHKGNLNGLKFN